MQLGRALELTEPLARTGKPEFITFSGGVAEYIFGRETPVTATSPRLLADGDCRAVQDAYLIPIIEPSERIRATVIGASHSPCK